MENYYKLLNIDPTATVEEIYLSYKDHINRFSGLPFLTDEMIDEVKKLKKAIYILGDPERREKYNILINKIREAQNIKFQLNDYNEDTIENTKINDRLFGDIFK